MFNYMRDCRYKISSKCNPIFHALKRRTTICDNCHKYIKQIGSNLEEYKRMTDDKVIETESMEWANKDGGVFTKNEERPVKDADKVIGKTVLKTVAHVTYDQLKDNQDIRESGIEKSQAEIETLQKRREKLGGNDPLNDEEIKIQTAIHRIGAQEEVKQIAEKIKNLEEEIRVETEFIEMRTKTLEGRPE